jgi:hypothetical protein
MGWFELQVSPDSVYAIVSISVPFIWLKPIPAQPVSPAMLPEGSQQKCRNAGRNGQSVSGGPISAGIKVQNVRKSHVRMDYAWFFDVCPGQRVSTQPAAASFPQV